MTKSQHTWSRHCATKQAQLRVSLICDIQLDDSRRDSHLSIDAAVSLQAVKEGGNHQYLQQICKLIPFMTLSENRVSCCTEQRIPHILLRVITCFTVKHLLIIPHITVKPACIQIQRNFKNLSVLEVSI